MSIDGLVEKTGAEKILLIRVLRMLVAIGMFTEPKPGGRYFGTKMSGVMKIPALHSWIVAS
jgi:hypothetical protein